MSSALTKRPQVSLEEPRGLSPDELALAETFAVSDLAPIAEQLSDNLMQLYIEGMSIDQLHENYRFLSRPCLQYTRWLREWDRHRQEHVIELTNQMVYRLKMARMEQMNYIIDLLAAERYSNHQEIKQYLKAPIGNKKPRTLVANAGDYKKMIESLNLLIAGGVTNKKVTVEGEVTVNSSQQSPTQAKVTYDTGLLLQQIADGEVMPERKS